MNTKRESFSLVNTYSICDTQCGAASLHYRNRAEITVDVCERKPYPECMFESVQKLPSIVSWYTPLWHLISSTATPCSMLFQNTNKIGCRGFSTQLFALSAWYPSSMTSHQSFVIFIGYQCPIGFSIKYFYSSTVPSSRCSGPCLPEKAPNFQGESCLHFKIQYQIQIILSLFQ